MAEDRTIIIDILKVLYLEDGEVNEDKEWTPLTVERIAEILKDGGYTPKSALVNPADFIAGWSIEDIHSNFEDDYPEMSDEVARYILHTLDDNHDANIGISWDVMTDTLWNILFSIKYDREKQATVMEEADAMELLEELCKDHGDSPKHITIHDYEGARKKWQEEHAKV